MSRASHQKLPKLPPPLRLGRGMEWPESYADDAEAMVGLYGDATEAVKALRALEGASAQEIAGRIEAAAARRRAGRRIDPDEVLEVDRDLREAKVLAEVAIAAFVQHRQEMIYRISADVEWRAARLEVVRATQERAAAAVAELVDATEAHHLATLALEWLPVHEQGLTDEDDAHHLARMAEQLAREAAGQLSRDPDRRARQVAANAARQSEAAARQPMRDAELTVLSLQKWVEAHTTAGRHLAAKEARKELADAKRTLGELRKQERADDRQTATAVG